MIQNKMPDSCPYTIGITGITGSGTSTVAQILADAGGLVIHADKLVHQLMQKPMRPSLFGEAIFDTVYEDIVKLFGNEILADNGEINRKSLGEVVFNHPEKLKMLESIIHPSVIAKIKSLLIASIEAKYPFAVVDAPLLIESGLNTICDEIWVIISTYEIRMARIMKRDNISPSDAQRRLKNRKGDVFLTAHADVVIENNGDLITLTTAVRQRLSQCLYH